MYTEDDYQNDLIIFAGHTNYIFSWDNCKTLIKTVNDETIDTIEAEDLTVSEANYLIENEGYTPIPF